MWFQGQVDLPDFNEYKKFKYEKHPAYADDITQWRRQGYTHESFTGEMHVVKEDYLWLNKIAEKIGLSNQLHSDYELAQDLLERMSQNKADFTRTFRGLCNLSKHYDPLNKKADESVALLFDNPKIFHEWLSMWRDRLQSEAKTDSARQSSMSKVNPIYIPRNHQIERIISAALENDFDPFEKLIKVLKLPFNEQPESMLYQLPPKPNEIVHATFCGT